MAVILLTSAPGSPGVTTTSLALALTWPRDVLLADCDREPSQVLLAGYLRGMDSGGRGLASIAQVHRERRSLHEELLRHTLPLTEGDTVNRRLLPGFSHPAAVRLFEGVWRSLGEAFEALGERGIDVIVDAGRIGPNALPGGLAVAADLVSVITRSSLRHLAALRLHLPALREQAEGLATSTPLGLTIVGPGSPYGTSEIAKQFALPAWAEVPHAPRAAAVLLDGVKEPRRFRDQLFMNRVRAQAKALSERADEVQRTREALVAHV